MSELWRKIWFRKDVILILILSKNLLIVYSSMFNDNKLLALPIIITLIIIEFFTVHFLPLVYHDSYQK